MVHALRAALTDQPILEQTILTKLPVFLLCKTYLAELVPPHTVPSLGDRHFKEIITDRQKLPDLSPLTGMRTTTKDALVRLRSGFDLTRLTTTCLREADFTWELHGTVKGHQFLAP